MVGGAVHSANTVEPSRKASSNSNTQETIPITSVVDTLESHKRIGFGTAPELVIMMGKMGGCEGGHTVEWG